MIISLFSTHSQLFAYKFNHIKIVCNVQSDNLSINDLITTCVAKEEKLKLERVETINLVGLQNKKHKAHVPNNIGNFRKNDTN